MVVVNTDWRLSLSKWIIINDPVLKIWYWNRLSFLKVGQNKPLRNYSIENIEKRLEQKAVLELMREKKAIYMKIYAHPKRIKNNG